MALRIEILADGVIEIMIPRRDGRSSFLTYPNADRALIVISYLIKKEIASVKREEFQPQILKDARREMQLLNERNPYGKKS